MDLPSEQLLALVRRDDKAASQLYDKYVRRLIDLARARMSSSLQQREDAEDIVQSVYRCFFENARQGKYELQRSGDLWRLLAAITVRKTVDRARFHSMGKRSMAKEELWEPQRHLTEQPTPDQAAALEDELTTLLEQQEGLPRRILELRLQGKSVPVIAGEVDRSERTVRRTLQAIADDLAERLLAND